MDLPPTFGRTPNLIFAMIGAKSAGKSHYLAVLIDQLKNRVGPALKLLLEPVNDRTMQRYDEEFYAPVYRRRTVIGGTHSAVTRASVPLIYTLSFSKPTVFGGSKIVSTVTIVFFDTAGEDLNSRDVMSTVNKYIYRADGLLLLLDPLQLNDVRAKLGNGSHLPEQYAETMDIVTRVSDLIRMGRDIGTTEKVKVPMAVAFSKMDAVSSLIDPQYQLKATPNHVGGFDVADFQAINGEMQSLVAQWQGDGILNQVGTMYQRYGFFGLSALGCNPHGTSHIERVLPHRVEDPFLWLLYQHGLLKPSVRR